MKRTKVVRAPGGRLVRHKTKKRISKHKCALCSAVLHGTPRGTKVEISKLKKSQRRPSRPFGGQLCTKCLREVTSIKAQITGKLIKDEDVPLRFRSYI